MGCSDSTQKENKLPDDNMDIFPFRKRSRNNSKEQTIEELENELILIKEYFHKKSEELKQKQYEMLAINNEKNSINEDHKIIGKDIKKDPRDLSSSQLVRLITVTERDNETLDQMEFELRNEINRLTARSLSFDDESQSLSDH